MTISLKHAFQSAKGDGPDPTRVQPSNWNAEHTLTCATGKVLGRATSGTGAVEELASTSFGRGTFNLADAAAGRTYFGLGGAAVLEVGTTAGTVAAGDHTHTFASLTSKPTTLSGYGITDGEPLGETTAINTQTASYTLVLTDKGKIVELNNASALNLTVPPNSSVAFPTKSMIEIVQYGAGQVTVVAGSGVTIRSSSGKLKLTGQYSGATLYKRATDEWVLIGDIAA